MPFDIAGNSRGYGSVGGAFVVGWILVLGMSFRIFGASFCKTKCKGCFVDLLSSNDKEISFDGAVTGASDVIIGFFFSVRFRRYLKNS